MMLLWLFREIDTLSPPVGVRVRVRAGVRVHFISHLIYPSSLAWVWPAPVCFKVAGCWGLNEGTKLSPAQVLCIHIIIFIWSRSSFCQSLQFETPSLSFLLVLLLPSFQPFCKHLFECFCGSSTLFGARNPKVQEHYCLLKLYFSEETDALTQNYTAVS